ncbi:MAG: hypothetical protein IJP95_02435, partial [Bacteroidales bacterium]|nr:hypothetical protein [Bacteroidales bacterium]
VELVETTGTYFCRMMPEPVEGNRKEPPAWAALNYQLRIVNYKLITVYSFTNLILRSPAATT